MKGYLQHGKAPGPFRTEERLDILSRVTEFILTFVACVALKATSTDLFFAGWIGGAIFTCVYWRVWRHIK
jgi:hypothetical protein